MNVYGIFQNVSIAVLVLASAIYVLRRQAPWLWKSIKLHLALVCMRPGRPAWLRSVARRLVPPGTALGTAATCDGCSGCRTPQH